MKQPGDSTRVKQKRTSPARKAKRPKSKASSNGASAEGKWIGKSLRRREEMRLVQGQGSFVDDKKLLGMTHMRVIRSPYAHARITSLDVSKAAAAPGVVCTLTGKEVAGMVKPFIEIGPGVGQTIQDFPLAVEKVVFQGEPVAVVVAESRAAAEDAAELVEVEYDLLPPVMTAEDALTDQSILHEKAGTNKIWHGEFEYGDVDRAFKQAAHIVDIPRLHFHRFSSTPLENNAVIGDWDTKSERITFYSNNSFPAFAAQFLSAALGVGIDQIRMHSIDIGGGFGIKITNYPYMAMCALASRKMGGRPVKWIETRTEHMLASAHGNERT
ncbi:MAG TPA: molybdopterin cofactor-binding domain-containing protein, partial [Candidatus Acidoferrales bacterium]|nr:molybdopterin cofactor-binding domain-containing protein [Candidatus Acidoferrales bacterium]